MKDAEIGSPFILSQSKSTHAKLWFLRKWRSLPRFFKLYLVIGIIVLFVIFCLVSNSKPLSISVHKERMFITSVPIRAPDVRSKNRDSDQSDQRLFNFHPSNTQSELSFKGDLLGQKMTKDQQTVIAAMVHSWNGYKKYAWGSDHLKPLTMKDGNWFSVGLTIVDSVDTLLLMGLEDQYMDAKSWIENDLTFDIYKDVNCFEMTIRVLGSLLSAFHLTKQSSFLHKSLDVGNRLIHCFDSPSKFIPFSDVNLRTMSPKSPAWSPDSSLSEVSTLQLEFRDLWNIIRTDKSGINDFPNFEEISFKTSLQLHRLVKERKDPLLPMYINPNNGQLTPSTITLGARGDSYYEYLLKQYLQTGIQWLQDDYLDAIDAIKERLIKTTLGDNKFVYVAEQLRRSGDINPKMDHLVCFLPGTLALGYYHYSRQQSIKKNYHGHIGGGPNAENGARSDTGNDAGNGAKSGETNSDAEGRRDGSGTRTDAKNGLHFSDRFADHLEMAEDIARTCYNMYNMTGTGLSPEIVYFGVTDDQQEMYIRPADSHNLLRPEYVESLFYLFHVTGNDLYRKQGVQIMDSFNRYCKVSTGGYTSIDDVRYPEHTRPKNKMESFWTAETLKYLFLLHSDDTKIVKKILDNYVFNTEAHLIPIRQF